MVKMIRIITYRNEMLRIILPEANPPHGLLLTDAEGLGPVEASISASEPVIIDGGYFNHARAGMRNIVLTFTFTWEKIIEDPRHLTSRYFPLKKKLKLDFITDRRHVFTWGYVETNEPDIWSDMEATQISIICPDPWLYDTLEPSKTVSLTDDLPLFEFPMDFPTAKRADGTIYYPFPAGFDSDLPWHWADPSNHDGVVNILAQETDQANMRGKRIIFGDVFNGDRTLEVYNPGDVEVGCWIHVKPYWDISYEDWDYKDTETLINVVNVTSQYLPRQDATLTKAEEWAQFEEELDSGIVVDMGSFERGGKYLFRKKDEIEICTIPGKRNATIFFSGITDKPSSFLLGVDSIGNDKWLTILPGRNWIRVVFNGPDGKKSNWVGHINVEIEFPVCYEGI